MSGLGKLPFPTLSSFTIWSNKVQPPIQGKSVDVEQESAKQDDVSDELRSLPSAVLFYSDRTSNLSVEKRNRQIGLLQGLVDFSAVLGFGSTSSSSALPSSSTYTSPNPPRDSSLRVVHSSKHKLLYYEPEAGFHICAMISVPESVEKSDNPSTKIGTSLSLGSQAKPPSSHPPSDVTLLKSMKHGYLEYRLLNGSMSRCIDRRKKLVNALEKFWSVWLWRWDVEKSGCGGVDFDQFLGMLHLSQLYPQPIPKRLATKLNTFIHKTCPEVGAIPILMNQKKIVHLPESTGQVTQQDINTLARYLLTLLGGSEAKTTSQHPIPPHPPPPFNLLSSYAIRSIDGLQEVSMKGLEGSSKWAQKAFSWASTSFATAYASDLDQSGQTIESLDEQLRAEMGLPPLSTSRQKMTKESLSNDHTLAETTPRPLPSGSNRTSLIRVNDPTLVTNSTKDKTQLLHYPQNLLSLYPPMTIKPSQFHYPHNLLHLYPTAASGTVRSSDDPCQQIASSSVNSTSVPGDLKKYTSVPNIKRLIPILDPRSPLYNVEFALADAMSEKNHTTKESSPIEAFVRHRMSTSLTIPEVSGDQTCIKRLSIFVGNGDIAADVLWLKRDDWNLAVITPSVDGTNSNQNPPQNVLLTESIRLIKRLSAHWTNPPTGPIKTGKFGHRCLIQLKTNELFYKQSSNQSAWLGKNEMWSGKQTNEKEVEICLGVTECMKDQPTEKLPIKEYFIRTEGGQWIVNKRIAKSSISQHAEVEAVLVLPSGSGTLIEADTEMRKLERVSEQVDFTTWK